MEASRVLRVKTPEARLRRSTIFDLIPMWITIGGHTFGRLVEIEISTIGILFILLIYIHALIAIIKGS